MGIKIDIKGEEEILKSINDLKGGIDPNVFADWANTIERTAKQICNDQESRRIKFNHTQTSGIEFEFTDKEAIDCVIKAIEQHKNSIPLILRHLSERVIADLKNKKNEYKESI